jgi:hypothetical protein
MQFSGLALDYPVDQDPAFADSKAGLAWADGIPVTCSRWRRVAKSPGYDVWAWASATTSSPLLAALTALAFAVLVSEVSETYDSPAHLRSLAAKW